MEWTRRSRSQITPWERLIPPLWAHNEPLVLSPHRFLFCAFCFMQHKKDNLEVVIILRCWPKIMSCKLTLASCKSRTPLAHCGTELVALLDEHSLARDKKVITPALILLDFNAVHKQILLTRSCRDELKCLKPQVLPLRQSLKGSVWTFFPSQSHHLYVDFTRPHLPHDLTSPWNSWGSWRDNMDQRCK